MNLRIQDEVSYDQFAHFQVQQIILLLSIVLENSLKKILYPCELKCKKMLFPLIKELESRNLISAAQKEYLVDFKDLRNKMVHSRICRKIFFRKKPILTVEQIRNTSKEILEIIVEIEGESSNKVSFNFQKVLHFLNSF